MPICHRCVRGDFGLGSKKVMLWPRNVWTPSALPTGSGMPFGNGFDSVLMNVRPLSSDGMMFVFWLKPLWKTSPRRWPRKP